MVNFQGLGAANYKPTLYPLNLDGEDGSSPKKSRCNSLAEICCERIVSDPSSIERALAMGEVPSELCWSLIKAALQKKQDVATQVRAKGDATGGIGLPFSGCNKVMKLLGVVRWLKNETVTCCLSNYHFPTGIDEWLAFDIV